MPTTNNTSIHIYNYDFRMMYVYYYKKLLKRMELLTYFENRRHLSYLFIYYL